MRERRGLELRTTPRGNPLAPEFSRRAVSGSVHENDELEVTRYLGEFRSELLPGYHFDL